MLLASVLAGLSGFVHRSCGANFILSLIGNTISLSSIQPSAEVHGTFFEMLVDTSATNCTTQARWGETQQREGNLPDTLSGMVNLASTFCNQNRWEEAEELDVQVLEIQKMKLGPSHPDTLTSMVNLASTYSHQGRWKEAEQLQTQVRQACRSLANRPDVLLSMSDLAATLWDSGRWSQAERLAVQVAQASRAKLGASHPDTLLRMANLAVIKNCMGERLDAVRLMRGCASILRDKLGPCNPHTRMAAAVADDWEH